MPVARLTGHKIVSGTQTVSTVNAATAVKAFTLQSDQNYVVRWYPPVYTHPRRAVIGEYMDFSQRAHGYYEFQWTFTYWTFGQLAYWRSQFLAGGAESAAVTVLTYDEGNTAMYLTCTLLNPHEGSGLSQQQVGGYEVVTLTFKKGVVIT